MTVVNQDKKITKEDTQIQRMSLTTTKEISLTLSNLISEANYSLQSSKDKILAVYNYAVEKDGYTPQEARRLVEKEIINVSNRHIRRILPEESKDQSKKNLYINHDADISPHNSLNASEEEEEKEGKIILPDGKLEDIPNENNNNIPPIKFTSKNVTDEVMEKLKVDWSTILPSTKPKEKVKERQQHQEEPKPPLLEYDQRFVEVHDEKENRNEHIVALIDDFLGLTEEQKTIIFGKTKRNGLNYHNALIDEAYNNILRIVKGLNDTDIPALLADIRFLKQILTKVADMALHEHELRKRNKEMMKE